MTAAKSDPKKQTKLCAFCGLPFNNRGKWARRGQWEEIRYCSASCRSKAKQKSTAA